MGNAEVQLRYACQTTKLVLSSKINANTMLNNNVHFKFILTPEWLLKTPGLTSDLCPPHPLQTKMNPSGGAVAAPQDDDGVNGDVPASEALLSQPEAPPPSQETLLK